MPRHWRCANGHAWTGDLGALTFCPDCGSADVYEVRPQYDSTPSAPAANSGADAPDRTFIQPAAGRPGPVAAKPATPAIADTLIQHLPHPGGVGDTFIQPPDPGTTLVQIYLSQNEGGTLVQAPAPGDHPAGAGTTLVQAAVQGTESAAEGATLVQVPPDRSMKDMSTLDLPPLNVDDATVNRPATPDSVEDGRTLITPPVTSDTKETYLYQPPADGGSVPPTPAETRTLDAPGGNGPSSRTTDYPETVSLQQPVGGGAPGLSAQETRTAPPPSARGKDGRKGAAPPVSGYEILGVLGRGGMGVVYKARQVQLNRIVALKMILAGGHAGAYQRQRFVTEANAVAALQHPNIVQIYETGERDGLPYFSLEYCDGGSLQQKLGGQPMAPKTAADIAEQLSRAMQYAHERGIVHRDLKPANILFAGEEAAAAKERGTSSKDTKVPSKDAKTLTKDTKLSRDATKDVSQSKITQSRAGQSVTSSRAGTSTASLRASRVTPKVTDFGLAKRLEDDSGLTGSGTILGTPSYMAPEQAEGNSRSVGPPADIHALGAILYEMLTGRPPFLGESVVETMNQVRTMDPVPPTRIQPKTPKDLETVCLKCLQKEMHKRYASAGELADDLRRYLHGEPIAARPVSTLEKGYKWAKRRPAQAGLIALSVAMLIASAVGGVLFGELKDHQAEVEKDLHDRAEVQRERAEDNFKSAREAVDSLLVRVGSEKLEHVPKTERLRKDLLEKSLDFYDRFLKLAGNDPAVNREAGWAYQRVGRIRNDLGDRKAAIAAYEKAIELFKPLAGEASDKQIEDQLDLAQTYRQLAVALEASGQPTQADAAYEAARAGLRELADANADRLAYRAQLADLLLNRGGQFYNRSRLTEAEDAFRQSLAEYDRLCRDDPSLANRFGQAKAQANLGAVVLGAGRIESAATELDKAVKLLAAAVQAAPDNPEYVKELGQTEFNLATAYFKGGENDDARRTYQQSVDRLTKLIKSFPETEDYRFALAIAHDNFAVFLKTTAGLRTAEPERQQARAIYDDLRRASPENLDYRRRYAIDLDEHAILLAETGQIDDAIAEEKIAADLLGGIAAADPRNPDVGRLVREAARRHLNLGQLFARNRQTDEAEAEYALAAGLLAGPADRRLRGDESWYELPVIYLNQAKLYESLRRGKAVERSLRQAVAVSRRIVAASPEQADAVANLASVLFNLASLPALKPAEAMSLAKEAVDRQRAALALAPKRSDLVVGMGFYGARLITLFADEGDHAAAAAAAVALGRDIPEWRGWPAVAVQLARCVRLARTDKNLSDEQKAKLSLAYGNQALELLRKAVAAGYKDAAALKESTDLEVMRTDPAFAPEFAKLLALIETQNKK